MSSENFFKYCIDFKQTRTINQKLYICSTCKISIDNGKDPIRSQKEFFGLIDFPDNFKKSLEDDVVVENNTGIKLNKLEDFLLKLAIPFLRVGHSPRGRYFRVKGSLIMISAELQTTMEKILPCQQNLIPVSFKRKVEYKGYFIEEYVNK